MNALSTRLDPNDRLGHRVLPKKKLVSVDRVVRTDSGTEILVSRTEKSGHSGFYDTGRIERGRGQTRHECRPEDVLLTVQIEVEVPTPVSHGTGVTGASEGTGELQPRVHVRQGAVYSHPRKSRSVTCTRKSTVVGTTGTP